MPQLSPSLKLPLSSSLCVLALSVGLCSQALAQPAPSTPTSGSSQEQAAEVDSPELDQPELDQPELKSPAVPSPKGTTTSNESTQDAQGSAQVKVDQLPEQLKEEPKRGDELYQRQISQIEAQVNELKEEIFRSRTRLAILKETVLAIGLSGAEAQIIHRNEMGANFKLERILYIIDGDPIRQVTDKDGSLDAQEEIEVFNGPITPENHTLQVELIYRGNGFGVFSYLQSYRFTLNDVYTFRPEEGKRVVIKTIGYERGGVTVDLLERPAIRFDKTEVNLEADERPGAQ